MINVIFTESDGLICGFELSGHSGYAESGSDIVCSAVSSAALMAANTVIEIQNLNPDITVNDGFLSLNLSKQEAQTAKVILDGLKLHLTALSKEYSEFIKVKISEV